MIIELRDARDDTTIRSIAEREIIALTHTDELNGADMLSITTLAPLEPGQHLVLKIAGQTKEYTVQAPKATREGSTVIYSDTALSSICDLFGVQPLWLGESFSMHADELLKKALSPAPVWSVEFPDGGADELISTVRELHYKSAREIITRVAAAGGFEIETHLDEKADKRVIVMRKHRGSTAPTARFSFGKNLLKVERTQRAPEITACYGAAGSPLWDGRLLMLDKRFTGKDYLINDKVDKLFSKRSCGGRVFGLVIDKDKRDGWQDFYDEVKSYLAEHSTPQVTYEASVLELTHNNAPVQSVQVGDTVDIVDPTFKPTLRCRGRITKLESDLLSQRTTVTLGNIYRDLGDLIAGRDSKLQSTIEQTENAAQSMQKASEERMTNIEKRLKELDEHVDFFTYKDYKSDRSDIFGRLSKLEESIENLKRRWN